LCLIILGYTVARSTDDPAVECRKKEESIRALEAYERQKRWEVIGRIAEIGGHVAMELLQHRHGNGDRRGGRNNALGWLDSDSDSD